MKNTKGKFEDSKLVLQGKELRKDLTSLKQDVKDTWKRIWKFLQESKTDLDVLNRSEIIEVSYTSLQEILKVLES